MRDINFGPVANPDGSPTDVTIDMLAGTGRDPVAFAMSVPAAGVFIPGSRLYRTDMDGNPIDDDGNPIDGGNS